ncbi:MAG TPA: outer membrane beta-barrel family protein, partial [Puia sp.]|nr:outer membrane beta-barrel family protein [Puia sp.]
VVDGKEFFGNDPKIATKNLPADAVDKVQVFDKKSDQAQYTGFDDGNSQKTINLTIKKDKKRGVFGKATAGAGGDVGGPRMLNETTDGSAGNGPAGVMTPHDTRYEGRLNLNQFNDNRQVSALAMVNNTNKQGFSFQDVLGFTGGLPGQGSGGNGQGNSDPFNSGVPITGLTDNSHAITSTRAGGLNFNDDWRAHTNVSGNYFYNNTDDRIDQKDERRYLLPVNSFTQDQTSAAGKHNENHRLAFILDRRIDSFNSIKLNSSFIYQNSNNFSRAVDSSRAQPSGDLLNDGFSNSAAHAEGYSWKNEALLRHRFAKKGRTLSADLSFALNNQEGGGSLYSVNKYYQTGGPVSTDTLNQRYDLPTNGNSYGVNLAYTEPLSKRSLLELSYNFYQGHLHSDKRTFDADGNGKFNLPDTLSTNDFKNTYTYHREGIQFRNQQGKLNFTGGATLQQASSANNYSYLTKEGALHRSFVNVLPSANFQYSISRYSNIRMFYTTYTNQPGITQLQPVADNSDPLNIKLGNPALKQEYYHSLRLNYIAFDPFRRTSFFAMLNYTGIHDRIVNDDSVDAVGVRVSRPVNMGGLYRANGNLSWSFPVRAIKSTLNLNGNIQYDHNANLVNGVRNNGNDWTLAQGADLNFVYKESFDLTAGIRAEYNDARYALQPLMNQSYWSEEYTADLNWYLPKGFSMASDLDYIHRSGLPAGYNTSPLIWNAGLAKQFLKSKKATLRMQVFDILKQNTGFARNTGQNNIEDVSYRVLNRYWLLSFTYNISRFAGKSMGGRAGSGRMDIKVIN